MYGVLYLRLSMAKMTKELRRKIGAMGGAAGHTGGFYGKPDLARYWGKIGGKIGTRPQRTKCLKGHPYTEETTAYNSRGKRFCRICRLNWQREYNKQRRKDPSYRRGKRAKASAL